MYILYCNSRLDENCQQHRSRSKLYNLSESSTDYKAPPPQLTLPAPRAPPVTRHTWVQCFSSTSVPRSPCSALCAESAPVEQGPRLSCTQSGHRHMQHCYIAVMWVKISGRRTHYPPLSPPFFHYPHSPTLSLFLPHSLLHNYLHTEVL